MTEAAAVFRGVLLMVFLSPIEGSCKFYLCHDRALVHSGFIESGNRIDARRFPVQGS